MAFGAAAARPIPTFTHIENACAVTAGERRNKKRRASLSLIDGLTRLKVKNQAIDPNELNLEIQRAPVTATELRGLASLMSSESEAHVAEVLLDAADDIERLRARLDEETSAHYQARNEATDLAKEIERLQNNAVATEAARLSDNKYLLAEIEKLRAALEWYAEPETQTKGDK